MQIGFDPRCAAMAASAQDFVRVMTEGERLGFDYATISDHLVSPKDVKAKYPYSPSGKLAAVPAGARHEQLTAIAFLAAKTSRLRFLTSVLVVPYRPAVLTAKMLSTIDILSGGRLTVGVGTGWMSDEFDAVGAPDFAQRGRVTDEYLEAMKRLWCDDEPQFEGEHVRFSGIGFEPKPAQKPHPPLWVGGLSAPAMRRVARFGDAWYPVPGDQAHPLDSFARLRAGMAKLRELTAAAGRDPDSVAVAMRVHEYGAHVGALASDGERRLFSGSNDDVAADLRQLREMGLCAVDFRFTRDSVDEIVVAMESFRRDIVDKI